MREEVDKELLNRINSYIEELFVAPDDALQSALEESKRAGLPEIYVTPVQGKLLQILAGLSGARRILEIGTLGGYSTIWLARALPSGGELISLELEELNASVARKNVDRAGLSGQVEIRVGDAKETLAQMSQNGVEPFDLIFIDADKESYPDYLQWSLRLSRPGSLILADNVIRGGTTLDPVDEASLAIKYFNQLVAGDKRLSAVVLPIIRRRIDGLAIIRVLE